LNDIDKRYSNTNEIYKPVHEKDGRIKYFIIPDNYEGRKDTTWVIKKYSMGS
jgi:hypothetical protein